MNESNTIDPKEVEFEILTVEQSIKLLNATESISFGDLGLEALKRNISRHNHAVNDGELMQYGGRFKMSQFMRNNKPNRILYPSGPSQGIIGVKNENEKPSFLKMFESHYNQETLDTLKRNVKANSTNDSDESKYPFHSYEELLEAVNQDVWLFRMRDGMRYARFHGQLIK